MTLRCNEFNGQRFRREGMYYPDQVPQPTKVAEKLATSPNDGRCAHVLSDPYGPRCIRPPHRQGAHRYA